MSLYDKKSKISSMLSKNVDAFKALLHYPTSNDLVFRFFDLTINNYIINCLIIFYDGMVNSDLIDDFMISRLTINTNILHKKSIIKRSNNFNIKDFIVYKLLSENQVSFAKTYDETIDKILHGDVALLIDGVSDAIICDVKKLPSRNVSKSENEMNIKGPAESFVENFRINTALIRKYVKDEDLVFETVTVGMRSKTRCSLSYITDITNASLILDVKKRIESIKIDYLLDSGQLEQLIEDKTFMVEPLILSTERPDKVASNLTEGRVAIIVEGSPNVLIVPAVYTDFLRASEDSYVRYPYTLLLRLFRAPAIFLSILLPGLYIAITSFHQEMLPTDLLFSIAGARERVPFSMLIELVIMEIAFEIIREASVRTPAPVGPTLGIVGTLILGQAIVNANIVSPVLVIIVALTGISTFAVPNFSLNYSYRILRFIYILLRSYCWLFRYSNWNFCASNFTF